MKLKFVFIFLSAIPFSQAYSMMPAKLTPSEKIVNSPNIASPTTAACASSLIKLWSVFPPPPVRRHIFQIVMLQTDPSPEHIQNRSAALALFHLLQMRSDENFLCKYLNESITDNQLEKAFNDFLLRTNLFKRIDNPVDAQIMADHVSHCLTSKIKDSFCIIENTSKEFTQEEKEKIHKLVTKKTRKNRPKPFWILLYNENSQNWFCLYFRTPRECTVVNHALNTPHPRTIFAIQKLYDCIVELADTEDKQKKEAEKSVFSEK